MRAKLTLALVVLSLFGGAAQAHATVVEALSLPNSAGGYMRDNPVDGWQIGTYPVIEEHERRFKWAIFDNGSVRYVYYKDEAPLSLTIGPDNNVWLTAFGGGESIDRFNPSTSEIVKYRVRPYPTEIVTGPDGALWFTSDWPAIGRITTEGQVTEYELPSMTGPEQLHVGPEGALLFHEHWANDTGRMTVQGAYSKVANPVATVAHSYRRKHHKHHHHKRKP